MQGLVFDIKEMAVFDGPGIRTTVFLKGCPLRCSWCHNPEGISPKRQLMVSKASCINCGACETMCSTHADPALCTVCGKCIPVCPLNLRKIAGTYYAPDQLARLVLKDRAILEANGGGITFSGGEPLLQSAFVLETIENLAGLHCAIETSGYAAPSVFTAVIDAVDYVIMDVKMVNAQLHSLYCGKDNRLILENLAYLKSCNKPFVIRIPVIPGVNDTQENFDLTAELLEKSINLEKVELLPYQKTAGAKYGMLGQQYAPGFDESVVPHMDVTPFTKRGIACSIL